MVKSDKSLHLFISNVTLLPTTRSPPIGVAKRNVAPITTDIRDPTLAEMIHSALNEFAILVFYPVFLSSLHSQPVSVDNWCVAVAKLFKALAWLSCACPRERPEF